MKIDRTERKDTVRKDSYYKTRAGSKDNPSADSKEGVWASRKDKREDSVKKE